MDNQKNIQTVKQLYADVVAKNLQGVFDSLTDDIRWEPPYTREIPHTKLQVGKDGVKEWVIGMAAEVSYSQVTPQAIYADNDAVIVKGFFEGKAIATGKPFESDWVHIWKFREDKICSYQAFWNTQRVASAMQ
jgi:ketosteroid isomerase-like protein